MEDIDKLRYAVESSDRKLTNTQKEIAQAIMSIYNTYLYSIDKHMHTYFWRRLRVGKFVIRSRYIYGDWGDGWVKVYVYYGMHSILKMNGTEKGNANTWEQSKFRMSNLRLFDLTKVLELQNLHNSLVDITKECLNNKHERLDKINNFQLALKELESGL